MLVEEKNRVLNIIMRRMRSRKIFCRGFLNRLEVVKKCKRKLKIFWPWHGLSDKINFQVFRLNIVIMCP